MIVLNGGSSSGTSSIARALQERLPDIWLTFGVDTFIDALPGRGDSPRAGISFEPDGTVTLTPRFQDLERSRYLGLSAMAASGARLILDEVLLSGGAGQDRLRSTLSNAVLFWVGVRCSPDVAAAREALRPDRVVGMARQQAGRVHEGVVYDLEVDTTSRTADECAQEIAAELGRRVLPE
ncbi:chloramphenicol phosphotransferase [Microbacterium caowuchunii]|nr:chloramphenicol phosphotransferase [Microbacterium caowuchunii]